jgi:23S rRNA (guanosine2251-2'-O)-methyltransferase
MNMQHRSGISNRPVNSKSGPGPKMQMILILDNIRSGHNVGSFFRTADAFRVHSIFLCGITAQPPQKEVLKTALGATNSVNWTYFKTTEQAIEQARRMGAKCIAVEQTNNAEILTDFRPETDKIHALVFGNEVRGVQPEVVKHCDAALEIPQFGAKKSMNVSVSVGILLWHFFMHSHPFQ